MAPTIIDDIDCGSFFDHIDDLVEFPSDNDSGTKLLGGCKDFPSIWNEALPDAYPPFPKSKRTSASELSAELSVPYEDILQLEWLSTFVEDSFSGAGMTLTKDYSSVHKETSQNQFDTSSPVSVLESSSCTSSSGSSSSSSAVKSNPLSSNHRGPQRARSKRPRPATFSPRPAIQFISPACCFRETNSQSAAIVSSATRKSLNTEHHANKFQGPKTMEPEKKKIKIKAPLCPTEVNQNAAAQVVRKCTHCEITKTPQWRAGPLGPKSLCNACGVRYKSGRLFPEYRPAASPTFVPSLHSNSHKKVLQMRSQDGEKNPVIRMAANEPTDSKRGLVVNNKPAVDYV